MNYPDNFNAAACDASQADISEEEWEAFNDRYYNLLHARRMLTDALEALGDKDEARELVGSAIECINLDIKSVREQMK